MSDAQRDKISQKVIALIKDRSSKDVKESSSLESLDFDSLDRVEMVIDFENEFSIEIPDEEAAKIVTVKDAVDYICKNKTSA